MSSRFYEGRAQEALLSLRPDQCLVVVLRALDETSDLTDFVNLINTPRICQLLSHQLLLCLISGTEDYTLFSQVYPVFTLPSVYVIKQGVAVDIIIPPLPLSEEDLYQRLSLFLSLDQQELPIEEREPAVPTVDVQTRVTAPPKTAQETILKTEEPSSSKSSSVSDASSSSKSPAVDTKPTVAITPQKLGPPTTPIVYHKAMIQVKLPDGRSLRSEFSPDHTLSNVRSFILSKESGLGRFILFQNIPLRMFTNQGLYTKACAHHNRRIHFSGRSWIRSQWYALRQT